MEVSFRHSPPQRVIVHCGLTKTGSTALQIQLFENREQLIAANIYIPKTGIQFDERMPGARRTDGHRFIFAPNGTERDWVNLQRELSTCELENFTLVLSCENMAQAGIDNFQAICDRFLGAPVEFHFLIRDFKSWLPSQVSEYAIGGNTRLMPDDPRLLSNPRHGITQQIERLCTLEQSGLDVHFHSYDSLKGDDIAFEFMGNMDKKLETISQFSQIRKGAGLQNKFEHNSRFVLLAMRFNHSTQNIGFSDYVTQHSDLVELALQPFYRITGDQSCVLSERFLETLRQQISSSFQCEFDKGIVFDLLFPTGCVEMPTASRFDIGELKRIDDDLEILVSKKPTAAGSASIAILTSRFSSTWNWNVLSPRNNAKAAIVALRRTHRGTKIVLWLRQFAWLRRLYSG